MNERSGDVSLVSVPSAGDTFVIDGAESSIVAVVVAITEPISSASTAPLPSLSVPAA